MAQNDDLFNELPMKVLMITQKLDDTDPLLAFTVGWVRALAGRVECLHVLCLERHLELLTEPLPANVITWSMGKETATGGRVLRQGRELATFYGVLGKIGREVDVIFCHMIPRFAWLSAPIAALYRKPIILWYVHRQISLELRLAVAVCKAVATSVPSAFPLPTPKLRVVGHGITTDFYAPYSQIPPDQPPLILQVARIMPIKHQETLLRAVASACLDVQIALVGEERDAVYAAFLKNLARELNLTQRVTFTGGLTPDEVLHLYQRATVAVNLSPVGLFDKAALESMLVGVPTVVSNPAFDELLDDPRLRLESSTDVDGLSDALRAVLSLSAEQREAMGHRLRQRVMEAHSLDGMMDHLVALMRETTGKNLA